MSNNSAGNISTTRLILSKKIINSREYKKLNFDYMLYIFRIFMTTEQKCGIIKYMR